MEADIFPKMKLKPGMRFAVIEAPPTYPDIPEGAMVDTSADADFIHIFVASRAQFKDLVPDLLSGARSDALVWVSYPKASGAKKPDINRNSLWDLVLPLEWHPVSQVSLDDTWSAIRLRPNEAGTSYRRPGTE